MVKGLFERDVKKKHIIEKVTQKGGKSVVEIPDDWAVDVEYVMIHKVTPKKLYDK